MRSDQVWMTNNREINEQIIYQPCSHLQKNLNVHMLNILNLIHSPQRNMIVLASTLKHFTDQDPNKFFTQQYWENDAGIKIEPTWK